MNILIASSLKEALKPDLSRLNTHLESIVNESDGFLHQLRSYVLLGSGKRVRPALVFLASQLGTPDAGAVQTVAMGVELIHIATLVHDDVIDKASLRRGRKTVAEEHGVDAAVLLGDHVFTYAFEKVADLNQPAISKLMARSTAIMCAGEIEQLKHRFQFDLSEKDYFSFIEKKTASLFGASARCGALLAGQDEKIQIALERFGLHLGIAFQIIDDLLDITGDEDIVGKTLHTDLTYGKMTLPLIYLRNQLSNSTDVKKLSDELHNPDNIPALIQKIRNAGALRYAEDTAHHHVNQALQQLDYLPQGNTRRLLTALVEMLQERRS